MLKSLATLLIFLVGGLAHSEPVTFALGTAFESRLQKEENPDYSRLQNIGQAWAKARYHSFGLMAELIPFEHRRSSSGSLSVSSHTTALGVWGRYELLEPPRWSPIFTLGTGMFFDRTTTQFDGSSDVRNSRRTFAGIGVGVTRTFWDRMLIEGELRAASVEERSGPLVSVILRAGIQI